MDELVIDLLKNNDKNYFQIKGNIEEVVNNRSIRGTLKRLQYTIDNNIIVIPFVNENQLIIIKEIQDLFCEFNIGFKFSDKTNNLLSSYNRELELFEEFSKNADNIRNNEFDKYPELYDYYKQFKRSLKNQLVRKLYPLQELSAFHMAFSQNSCNFAVPGAGKTSIVYGAYAYLKSLPDNDPKKVDRLLVIGPLSSFAPWENEYKKCFDRDVLSFRMSGDSEVSSSKKQQHLYSSNPAELTLIFHGSVDRYQKDISDFLKRNRTMVVVDEAHRIKNPVGTWGLSVAEISKDAKARVILTGTPVPNGYQDIYNLYKFILPFKYKDVLGFHYHNLKDMTDNCDPESNRVVRLKENLSPFFIRIRKKDLNLPKIEENIRQIEMNPYQREIYDFIEAQYIEDWEGNGSATVKDLLNRAKLIRLRQAATNPALLEQSLKNSLANDEWEDDPNSRFTTIDLNIDDSEFFKKICDYSKLETPHKFIAIKDLLLNDILKNLGKVIIWTIFIQNAKGFQEYLKKNKIKSKLLIGEIPQDERERTIEKFNDPNNNDFQVVIANPFSVAESISLHKGCHNAIYMERDYNCSNFIQSKDRIHRVGLEKDQLTRYFYFISINSIDEVIEDKLKIKIKRMEEIIDDDIPLFSRLNDEDETDIIQELILNYDRRS
jgi:SNF2 family DNA or RNA helicase